MIKIEREKTSNRQLPLQDREGNPMEERVEQCTKGKCCTGAKSDLYNIRVGQILLSVIKIEREKNL